EARLLIKQHGYTLGLWVWLGTREPLLLFHWAGVRDGHHSIGMALMPGPGSSVTWCGQIGEGHPGEPKGGSGSQPGIDLFWCESSNQLIWWDRHREGFRFAWITD